MKEREAGGKGNRKKGKQELKKEEMIIRRKEKKENDNKEIREGGKINRRKKGKKKNTMKERKRKKEKERKKDRMRLENTPSTIMLGLMSLKASMTTFPLTDWMGSTTTATARSDSASKLCWVLMSTPRNTIRTSYHSNNPCHTSIPRNVGPFQIRAVGQNQVIMTCLIIHFHTSSGMSAHTKQVVQSK